MPDPSQVDGPPDTRLQLAQPFALVPKQPDTLMPAEWTLAWEEFGRRHPRLKRGALIVNALLFNVAGLSVLAILSAVYGWLPWWAFALTLLTTITVSQTFVIRFAGLARERITLELAEKHARDIEALQRRLTATQAVLAGKILCLTEEVHKHQSELPGLFGDCWFTMSVNLWNDGGTATNVTGFRFRLGWTSSGDDWPARQVEGLDRFRAKSVRPGDPGSKDLFADEIENLFDFPVPTEITLTNSQRGWLRFVVRGFPLKEDMKLDQDSVITLIALDKKGEPHTIYQGSLSSIGLCPPIEAIPARAESRLEIRFDEHEAGFVDHTIVSLPGRRVPCKLYRVSVIYHGPRSTIAELKAEEVTLTDGRRYPPMHLRITGRRDDEKQARLSPGAQVFWDVVEKENTNREWVTLLHTEQESGILQRTSASFKITASCDDDLPVTKVVQLRIRDNGDLDFRLSDV